MKHAHKVCATSMATLAALALGATLDAAMAADSASQAAPPAGHHWHGARGHRGYEVGLFTVLHQLKLDDGQKQQLKSILGAARVQWQAQPGSALNDLPALGNPGDPNHAAAVAAAQQRAAQRVQQRDGITQQVYAILTPSQKAQLPALLAQLQTQMAARRNAHGAG